jgi:hypothetical protein
LKIKDYRRGTNRKRERKKRKGYELIKGERLGRN